MYTVCYAADRGKRVSLLFESTELEAIARDPEVAALFPLGYFVKPVGGSNPGKSYWGSQKRPDVKPKFTLVTTMADARLPDAAKLGEPPMTFYVAGVAHLVDLRVRFNQCLSLFKAVGCKSCPERGSVCLSEGAAAKVPTAMSEKFEGEELIQMLTTSKTVIAGHTFATPMDTRVGPFFARLRPYWEHDFTEIAYNKKSRSARAVQAAETRGFKKTQCSKCVLKDNCEQSRYCKGALPPEQEIIDACAPRMLELIAASDMPEWQLWELARNIGKTAKHSRWQIMLTGLKLQGNKLEMQIHRAKMNIQPYHNLKTYEEVAKVFELALTEKDVLAKHGSVLDPGVLATWWLILHVSYPHQNYGWGCRRKVLGIGVASNRVLLEWSNGRYISHSSDLWKVADVAPLGSYGSLPGIERIHVR